mmetsp:Transcript_18614/g.40775  ORF Transcript_18614/g.40775 Transcript_18614/m.40775 type:complete len:374 (-) Transcript_18614:190-1311(-)
MMNKHLTNLLLCDARLKALSENPRRCPSPRYPPAPNPTQARGTTPGRGVRTDSEGQSGRGCERQPGGAASHPGIDALACTRRLREASPKHDRRSRTLAVAGRYLAPAGLASAANGSSHPWPRTDLSRPGLVAARGEAGAPAPVRRRAAGVAHRRATLRQARPRQRDQHGRLAGLTGGGGGAGGGGVRGATGPAKRRARRGGRFGSGGATGAIGRSLQHIRSRAQRRRAVHRRVVSEGVGGAGGAAGKQRAGRRAPGLVRICCRVRPRLPGRRGGLHARGGPPHPDATGQGRAVRHCRQARRRPGQRHEPVLHHPEPQRTADSPVLELLQRRFSGDHFPLSQRAMTVASADNNEHRIRCVRIIGGAFFSRSAHE